MANNYLTRRWPRWARWGLLTTSSSLPRTQARVPRPSLPSVPVSTLALSFFFALRQIEVVVGSRWRLELEREKMVVEGELRSSRDQPGSSTPPGNQGPLT